MLGIAPDGPNRMKMHDYQELGLTGSTSRGKRFSTRMPSTKSHSHSQTSAKPSNENTSASSVSSPPSNKKSRRSARPAPS
ncbi:hypothetical protein N7449_000797 [Penicillium cf. viridicatum]|uniref:Uncharacterized protein n=1 Tax=Penicillium cf. viridicatum TaxID=2972119 RepID=A0A9W9N5J4_9EURO|nr:hypothetical protein N7449_000797 [Penicillium cf. viridicatum]